MSLKLTEGHVPRTPDAGHDLAVVPPGLSTTHEVMWAVELEPGLDSLQILVEAIQVVLGLADLGLELELVLALALEKTPPHLAFRLGDELPRSFYAPRFLVVRLFLEVLDALRAGNVPGQLRLWFRGCRRPRKKWVVVNTREK